MHVYLYARLVFVFGIQLVQNSEQSLIVVICQLRDKSHLSAADLKHQTRV